MNKPERRQPNNKLFNGERRTKMMNRRRIIRLTRGIYHLGILTTTMFINRPLTVFTRMIRMRRKDRHVSTGSISIMLLRPRSNINRRRITRLITTVIRRRNTPLLIFTLTKINILVRINTIRGNRPITVLKRITKGPIRGSPGTINVTLVSGMRRIFKNTMTKNSNVVTHSLMTPKTVRKILNRQRRLSINGTRFLRMKGRPYHRFSVNRRSHAKLRFHRNSSKFKNTVKRRNQDHEKLI